MKTKLYFIFALIILMNCSKIFAQDNFAPVGATWYHSGRGGIFKTKAVKDTLIDGQNCRKLSQDLYFSKPKEYPFNLFYHSTTDVFVYGTEDTVFIYNPSYRRFTPLYVFNVKIGDTIKLPYINFINCAYVKDDTTKASLSFVVDSVKYNDYKGILLKTVYSKVLKTKNTYFGWCKWGDSLNIYSEKIGTPNFGLLPQCLYNCIYTSGEDICPQVENLLCYNDSVISINYYDTCLPSSWVPSGLDEKALNDPKLKIFPNPAIDKISLGFESLNFDSRIFIYDAMGKKIADYSIKKSSPLSIDIVDLKAGLYYVRLFGGENNLMGSNTFVKQ